MSKPLYIAIREFKPQDWEDSDDFPDFLPLADHWLEEPDPKDLTPHGPPDSVYHVFKVTKSDDDGPTNFARVASYEQTPTDPEPVVNIKPLKRKKK